MGNKQVVGLGLILLVVLIAAMILCNRQQGDALLAAAARPSGTPSQTAPPPPTFNLVPTASPITAVATFTTIPTQEPSAIPPTPTASPPPEPIQTPTNAPQPVPALSATETSITFAVIGDYGFTGQGTIDVAAMVNQWQPDIIITVGDNNYPNGAAFTISDNITQHYGTYIAQNRFYPALGNHDYHTDLAQPYFDYFDLPGNERYYDFVWGDVHFFAINSDWQEPDGITAESRQARWLQERLAASESPWQIVYFHAPPFVSNADKIVPVMNWPFAAWGADIVFSGHAHVYERLTIDGIPYIVNGVGGHSIYNFDETPHPASEIRYNGDFGAVLVEVGATELTLRFVNRGGGVIDEFTVIRP